MATGSTIVPVRIPAALLEEVDRTIRRVNLRRKEKPYERSDFIRAALSEKIDHYRRSNPPSIRSIALAAAEYEEVMYPERTAERLLLEERACREAAKNGTALEAITMQATANAFPTPSETVQTGQEAAVS